MKKLILCITLFAYFVLPITSDAAYGVCRANRDAIIYVNGMLNTENDARNGLAELKNTMKWNGFTKVDDNFIEFHLAYNPSHLAGLGDTIKVAIQKSYDQMQGITGLDYDAKEMLSSLHDEVGEGRILFVPHSQGNFYANSMYKWIVAQKDGLSYESMNMYNVASPAQGAAKNSKYILSETDHVIAGLVGSVGLIAWPNVKFKITPDSKDQQGHSFVDSYLTYGGKRMVEDIKSQLAILKADKNKAQNEPCIPLPDTGTGHEVLSAVYSLADPVSNVIKNTIASGFNFFGSSLATVATSLGYKNKTPTTPEYSAYDDSMQKNQWSLARDIPIQAYSQPVIKPITTNIQISSSTDQVEGELLASYLKRINNLKQQILLAKKDTTKYLGSGSSYYPPATFSPLNPLSNSTTSTSTLNNTNSDNITASTTENSTTTAPIKEEPITLGVDILAKGEVRVVEPAMKAVSPEGHLMISEYYLGKEGEASWVEVFNTSKDGWIDTSHVVFMEGNTRIKFPVTSVAPFSSVILRSEGKALHSMMDNNVPVSVSLDEYIRGEGGIYLILQNDTGGESAFDYIYYGGEYCKNKYSYSRSCERMVTLFPGNNSDFWVRARVIDASMDPKLYSTIGRPNMSWDFDTYEGRKIKGMYPSEVIKKNNYGYISGPIIIPSGTEKRLDYNENWWLIKSEGSLFGDENQTKIDVYGKLRTLHMVQIDVVDRSPVSINIYEGGSVIRDPYSFINMYLNIRGGSARVNGIRFGATLYSGKLYITNYDDGSINSNYPTCSGYRGGINGVNWIGGKIFIEGYDCGNNIENPDQSIGDFDINGVIIKLDTPGCPNYWNDNGELVCGVDPHQPPPFIIDTPSPNVPPYSGTSTDGDLEDTSDNSTTTASSTQNESSGQGSSTSTQQTEGGGSTAPGNNGGEVAGTSTSTPGVTPPILENSTSSPTDNSGGNSTSTETGTGEQSNSTSTNNNGNSTSTEIIFPIISEGGNSTSTSTSTQEQGGTSSTTQSGSGQGDIIITATSTLDINGLTMAGCYDGTLASTTNEIQRAVTCGNGWSKRPPPLLNEIGMVLRPARESRFQITEYYIGKADGEGSWVRVSNMTQNAQLYLADTDFIYNGRRIPFPYLEIPANRYVILRTPGTFNSPIPVTSNDNGIITTIYKSKTVMPSNFPKEGNFKLIFAWNPFSPIETLDDVNYSSTSCDGEITESGTCKLNKPYLVWNDASDGWIN